jgi:DNA-binding transcriptional regulator YhcF (GntR family)
LEIAAALLIILAVKIWISKNSEVPVSEQLAAQITLAIAAGDFRLGDKLPSTREIARRCGVHANTVGAVYRKLADQKLIEFRQGSGFYVTESAGERIEGARRLNDLIDTILEQASALGFTRDDVLKRMRAPRASKSPDRVVLIEPDDGLRGILIHELSARSIPVIDASLEDLNSGRIAGLTLIAAMFDEKPKIESVLKDGQRCVYLKGRSVSAAMSGESRPRENDVIAVVSGWDGFLTFARIMLLAAKIDPGNLIVRSTAEKDWKKSINGASIVICDALTAHSLDGLKSVRSFQVVADESISEIETHLQRGSAS